MPCDAMYEIDALAHAPRNDQIAGVPLLLEDQCHSTLCPQKLLPF